MARRTIVAIPLLLLHFTVSCAKTSSPARGTAHAGAGGSGGQTGQLGRTTHAGSAQASDAGAAGEAGGAGEEMPINGVDLTVWDRYLGKPTSGEPALGIDNDPRGVYSIVTLDGEPAIRISGELWGSLISKREFCNFRLRGEFKWGSRVWPPLNARDSGIMFLSTGPLGAVNAGGNALSDPIGSGSFMVAAEYQIAAGDVGSLYNLGPIAFIRENSGEHQELPELWNTIEISLVDDQARLSLNGQETLLASSFVLDWPGASPSALRCGKLQLQSEGAEIFFRRLEIRALP